MKKLALLFFAIVVMAAPALAQFKKVEAVQVAPFDKPLAATAGRVLDVPVQMQVKPGFHINAEKPTFDYMIPTKLDWTTGELKFRHTQFPTPEKEEFEFAPGTKLDVYQGDLTVTSKFEVPSNAKPGKVTLQGKLRYQACDNKACYPPITVPLSVPVEITTKKKS